MPAVAFPNDFAGSDVQRREQRRRTVAFVIAGSLLGETRPQWQDWLSAVQRLHLRLLVGAQDDCMVWRVDVKTHNVPDLLCKIRIGRQRERFRSVRLQSKTMPDPHDRALTQSDLACQRTRAPLGVGPRQCFQRLRHRFFHLGVGDFPRRLVDPLRDGIRDAARASCELSGNCRGDEPMEDYRKRAQRTREVVGALNGVAWIVINAGATVAMPVALASTVGGIVSATIFIDRLKPRKRG
jgi:hypothetical protein